MSFSVKSSISGQQIGSSGNGSSNCSSNASSQLKIYRTFIFSVPIFFTFILLFLFYWFYLQRRRADWSTLRMRANNSAVLMSETGDDLSRCELGLKKELREMLPIVVFNQSFSVKDTQCSVCLGEYQPEDRLQQIPSCRHTFHMDCIDLWLTMHTTCPLCRQSLLASTKPLPPPDNTTDRASHENDGQSNQDPQTSTEPPSPSGAGETDEAAVGIARDQDMRCDEEAERVVAETVK